MQVQVQQEQEQEQELGLVACVRAEKVQLPMQQRQQHSLQEIGMGCTDSNTHRKMRPRKMMRVPPAVGPNLGTVMPLELSSGSWYCSHVGEAHYKAMLTRQHPMQNNIFYKSYGIVNKT